MGAIFGGALGLREAEITILASFSVIQSPLCGRYLGVLLGCGTCFGEAPKLDRIAKYHHNHCSVDTSTTNAPIENWTKGDDFLWCNVPSANGIKKLGWFCITGCGIATGTANPGLFCN